MKRWLVRIAVILVIVEVAYVAAVNAALNLPATQAYINQLKPEKFRFRWDQAWSWYPFRVHVTNFNGNFQSWSQQWEVSAPEVSGTFAITALMSKTVHFYNMDGGDIDLKFRPRPRPDRNDADIRQFYPTIEGRDPNLAAEPTPTEEPGMKLVFEIAHAGGENSIWFGGLKTTLAGDLQVTVTQQTKHGPLTISDGRADVTVKELTVDGKQVSNGGTIKGTFDLGPFIPYKNRGLKALAFFSTDAEIELPIDRLDFLNVFFKPTTGVTVGGNGALNGRLVFDKDYLKPGTDVTISANSLTVAQDPFVVDGDGTLKVQVAEATPDTINSEFRFVNLGAKDQGETLFEGKDLVLAIDRSSYVVPENNDFGRKRVEFRIPSMTVPNLAAYQRFLPAKWRVALVGGTGSLEGTAELTPSTLTADLALRSEEAELQFNDKDSFKTDLALILKAAGEASNTSASIDISGSSLSLDDSNIKTPDANVIDSWKATLTVSKGVADFSLPGDDGDGRKGFQKLVDDRDIKELLATLDGQFTAGLVISDLDWANNLFNNPYSLAFTSSAEIDTDLTIRKGYLAEGSKLQMQPQTFALNILDYIAEGSGGFDLTVDKGGDAPDLSVSANLTNASFRRDDEKQAVIDDVTLALQASTKGVSLKDGGEVTAVNLVIPSAKVTDMTAYNAYLPKGSPVRILGGTADLNAKLDMQESTAGGFVKLKTSRVTAALDGQRISGTIGLDVKIDGGSAKDKTFNITGSSLSVDGVRLAGESAAQRNWSARIDFGKSRVVWSKQTSLDANAKVRMTDTRPLVAFFAAHRKGNEWLDRVLDLEDVRGNATIKVEPNAFIVPYALAKSDTIEVGAKGIFSERNRQGMYYARYGALAGILAFDNGKRHFALLGATKKFEEYVPGGKLPGLSEGRASPPRSSTGRARKGPFSIFKRK